MTQLNHTNTNTNKSLLASVAIMTGVLFAPGLVTASSETNHGHQGTGHMGASHEGEQTPEDKGMKHVISTGRINKVMAKGNMVNITHEPISELNWPKMRMNFQTSDKVNLHELKPGQEVQFKLQMGKDHNYLIDEIHVVK